MFIMSDQDHTWSGGISIIAWDSTIDSDAQQTHVAIDSTHFKTAGLRAPPSQRMARRKRSKRGKQKFKNSNRSSKTEGSTPSRKNGTPISAKSVEQSEGRKKTTDDLSTLTHVLETTTCEICSTKGVHSESDQRKGPGIMLHTLRRGVRREKEG